MQKVHYLVCYAISKHLLVKKIQTPKEICCLAFAQHFDIEKSIYVFHFPVDFETFYNCLSLKVLFSANKLDGNFR